jgi:predicted AlkP superfamily phosphohydrolase/phosphomutase
MRLALRPVVAGAAMFAIVLAVAATADAYVGPGAGIALGSSLLSLVVATILALFVAVTWPARWVLMRLRRRRAAAARRVRRVIVLGLDGQDPELTERFMAEGLLPNFTRLAGLGSYHRLRTTLLAESPVAWSSFQTGCNPGKHRIFDFLVPNRRSYLPELCSARVDAPARVLRAGPIRIPIGRPRIRTGRRSVPFWKILGEHGVFSTVLRVPITFPAEPFHGLLLSAMSVPDLRGTQGTYHCFSSDSTAGPPLLNGDRLTLRLAGDWATGIIPGPADPFRPSASLSLEFRLHLAGDSAVLHAGAIQQPLVTGQHSPWVPLVFTTAVGSRVHGIARFCLVSTTPHVALYVTPVNLDPDHPAVPISHPTHYASYLARTQGRFSTLGLAEDTSALNEAVIDEDMFLDQVRLVHHERERMYFDALDNTREGVAVCVFDITDRIQHMFFRHLDPTHPANRGRNSRHADAIPRLYREMDELVGRTMERIDDDTVLIVMSDHGFKPFTRAVNLNSWLYAHGFLALKQPPTGTDMFADVDWSKTLAYAVGFGGIYLNLAGRESQGIVTPGADAHEVMGRIRDGLLRLFDEREEVAPVRQVYAAADVYSGPYVADAPDLIVGFRPGYRVGWLSVTGGVSDTVIEDNDRCWSGDHNFNPADVPGVLFCNRRIDADSPGIMDIAPTILDLFGIGVPAHMDGVSLMPEAAPV